VSAFLTAHWHTENYFRATQILTARWDNNQLVTKIRKNRNNALEL